MIPLRSTLRINSKTIAVAVLIAINVLVFLYQLTMDPEALETFVEQWGIIPDTISGHLYTLLTSMFLHGGWLHLLGTMLFLWVFGRNVEDLIGSGRFAGFYIAGGLAAGVIQVVTSPYSRVPTIGASGAIAAVMGAYLLKFPKARIITLIPIFFFITTAEIPAWLMLLYWFFIQVFSGFGSLSANSFTGGGVAWFAHIGGFIAGILIIRLFPAKPRWRPWYEEGS
jgi:membrane associated rhomboid family serine protease